MATRPQLVAESQKIIQSILAVPPGLIDLMTVSQVVRAGLVGMYRAMGREDMARIIEAAPPPNPMAMMPGPGGPPGKGPPGKPGGPPNGPPKPQEGDHNGDIRSAPPPGAPGMGPGPGNASPPPNAP